MKRTWTIGALIAILFLSFAPPAASANPGKGDARRGGCIWDNAFTWDLGRDDDGAEPTVIPGGDDPGTPFGFSYWYVTTYKCADINISLTRRPQPLATIGVRVCFFNGAGPYVCDPWKFWGTGFNGWLELNAQQPSVPDGKHFFVEMYGVDPYTAGWIAA